MSFISATALASYAIGGAVISGGFEAYSAFQQGAAQKKFADYEAQQQQVDAQAAIPVGQAKSKQVAQQAELNSQTLAFKKSQ